MNKILKAMIYVDEMDAILLKVKGQGTYLSLILRQNIFLYDILWLRGLHPGLSSRPQA
jgi:hypothetical protein